MTYTRKTTSSWRPPVAKRSFDNFKPTAEQDAFRTVLMHGSGNVILSALAGTGKTTTIEWGGHCISLNAPTSRVFYLCFNKNIKEHLRELGLNANNFHGMGLYALLKKYGENGIKVVSHRGRAIAAQVIAPQASCMDDVSDETYSEIVNLAKIVSLAKGFFLDYRLPGNKFFNEGVNFIIDRYDLDSPGSNAGDGKGYTREDLCRMTRECMLLASKYTGEIDQDDMVWFPLVNNLVFGWADVVMVDESQDLNPVQVEMAARTVKRQNGRLVFVGDKNQAIYLFRGALPDAMEKIQRRFDCKVMPLNTTFRCGKAIVQEANVFVPELVAHESNCEGTVDSVGLNDLFCTQAQPGDAVISRTRAPLFKLALMLLGKHVRVTVKGDDIADGLINTIEKSNMDSLGGFLGWLEAWESQERNRLAGKYRDREEFEKRIGRVVDTVDVFKTLCASLNNTGTTENLISLIRRLCEKREGEEGKSVMLMTAHGSKGLEFDHVWMVKETFRSTTQEERNLSYVCVTRAKKHLTYLLDVVTR